MEPIYKHPYFNGWGDRLYDELDWIKVQSRRSECFMADGEVDYQYVEGGHVYKSVPFHPIVKSMMEQLNEEFGYNLDICFANMYEDERDALGWHSDDAFSIDQTQPIISASFGAVREIWWKPIGFKSPSVFPREWRQKLENGSIFIMPGGMQSTHMHKIPKSDVKCGPRVSLTFRSLK